VRHHDASSLAGTRARTVSFRSITRISRFPIVDTSRKNRYSPPRVGRRLSANAGGPPTISVRDGLVGLCVASVICVALELVREFGYDVPTYRFLLWNLALAWIPLLLALLIYMRSRRGASLVELAPIVAVWVLFLPNAPYIATDFIHLDRTPGAPLWFDGAILAVFACAGIALGFISVYLVHAVARARRGVLAGWCSVTVALVLASAGIFLGRFLRWNSWDVLVRPGNRLAELVGHLSDPSAVARATVVTSVVTLVLTSVYACFYTLVRVRLEPNGAFNHARAPHRL
jgi:uncharacterized membrane protein